MKAYVEWLHLPPDGWEGAVGIVRAGPQAEREPDPYDYSVTFKVIHGFAVARGGVMPSGDPQVFPRAMRAHATAGAREVERITGLTFAWIHKGRTTQMSKHFAKSITELSHEDKLGRIGEVAALVAAGKATIETKVLHEDEISPGRFRLTAVVDYTEK